jgi:outer membrane protein
MKKSLLALTLAALSGGAAADTIYGIYAGGGSWQASYEGDAGGTDGQTSTDLDTLNMEDSDNVFVYVAIEHPVPLVPNVRVAHTKIRTEGSGELNTTFVLDGREFQQGTNIGLDLDLTHTDGTLYYELLDNWVSFDLGVTARVFDGHIEATSLQDPTLTERVDFTTPVPMGYARAQFELPLTGWRFAAAGNYVSYSGDSFSDLDAKFGYMTDGLVLDFGLDIGYRAMNLDISDEDFNADISIAGPYIEASLHF